MPSGDINVGIDYEGTEQGATQLDGLISRLTATEEAQNGAARSAKTQEEALKRNATATAKAKKQQDQLRAALSTQIQGWGALGSAVGQVGAVLGRVAPKFAGFGAVLAQAGQSVTAVATALAAPTPGSVTTALVSVGATIVDAVSAFQNYQNSLDDTSQSTESFTRATNSARASTDDLIASIGRATRARARESRAEIGVSTLEEREAGILEAQKAQRRAQVALTILTGDRNRLARSNTAEYVRQFDTFRDIEASLGRQITAAGVTLRAREAENEALLQEEQTILRMALAEDVRGRAAQQPRGGGGTEDREAEARRRAILVTLRIEAEGMRALTELTAREEQARRDEYDRTSMFRERLRQLDLEREREAIDAAGVARIAAIDKETAAREEASALAIERRREESSEIASTLASITQAVTGAFEAAIEGEKSLEEALLEATKMLLKQFGIEMVAKGIGKILEGISELPSPTAAPKIGGGAAMVAFGIGLGAVGAAIPSAGAGGNEAPREDAPAGDAGGPSTLVINVNNPVMAAATHAQLARALQRQLQADRTIGPSTGNR